MVLFKVLFSPPQPFILKKFCRDYLMITNYHSLHLEVL